MSEQKVYKSLKSLSGLEAEIILGNCDTGNQKQMQLWSSNIYWVREDIRNIKTSFIKLGFHLCEIKRCNAYCIYGYDDFYEFCDNNFHLSSSAVRRHIQIYERFGEYRDNSMKMNIAREYEKYSYSQLCEMLPMSSEEIEGIRSTMTIKEIREYKASLKNEKLQNLAQHLDKLSKESDVDKAELKNKDCATSHKKCDAKKFQGTCVDCFYHKNLGCPFPEEHETVTEPEVCDVAQEKSEKEKDCVSFEILKRYRTEELNEIVLELGNFSAGCNDACVSDCISEVIDDITAVMVDIENKQCHELYVDCIDIVFDFMNLLRKI